MLLGAHAEGVRNILAVTGDPPEVGDYPGARGVYEIDSIGLVELLARLNQGEDFLGRAIDAPTSFFLGVAVNPTADDLGLELERFHRKVAAGARFAMTQVLFDLERLEAFRERIGGTWPIPVLVGVWPMRTYETLCACTTRCRGSSSRSTCWSATAARARRRAVGLALATSCSKARARRAGRLRDRAVQAAENVVELLPDLRAWRRSSGRDTARDRRRERALRRSERGTPKPPPPPTRAGEDRRLARVRATSTAARPSRRGGRARRRR